MDVSLKIAEDVKMLEQQMLWDLINKHKNFYPKSEMDFVLVLIYSKTSTLKKKPRKQV